MDIELCRLLVGQITCLGLSQWFIFYHQSQRDIETISFCNIQAAFLTFQIVFQRLLASIHMTFTFFAFKCFRLLLKIFRRLLEWLPKILRVLLVFGNNFHRLMLPVLHLWTFLATQDVLGLSSQKINTFKSCKLFWAHSLSHKMFSISCHQNMWTFGRCFLPVKVIKISWWKNKLIS